MNITRECRCRLLKCYTLYIYDSLLVAAGARTRAVQETQKGVAARAKHGNRREVITRSACLLIVNTLRDESFTRFALRDAVESTADQLRRRGTERPRFV